MQVNYECNGVYALIDELEKARKENRLEVLRRDDKNIGLFTWDTYVRKDRLFVYLYNLFILPEFHNKLSLFYLRKKLRSMFPNAVFYWERDRYHRRTYKT